MKQQQRDNKRSFTPQTARTTAKAKLPVAARISPIAEGRQQQRY
jgi:hypothetical protein